MGDERLTGGDSVVHNLRQINAFLSQFDLSPADAGNFHKIIHQHQMVDRARHHVAHPRRLRAIGSYKLQGLQAAPYRRQRISQLVSEDRQEHVLAATGFTQGFFDHAGGEVFHERDDPSRGAVSAANERDAVADPDAVSAFADVRFSTTKAGMSAATICLINVMFDARSSGWIN
jgi:hypothetical protein